MKQYTKQIYFSHKQTYREKRFKLLENVLQICLFYRQDKELLQLMLPVMTTRLLRQPAHPAFAFNQINEREEKIIGKKEVKTEYYSESK